MAGVREAVGAEVRAEVAVQRVTARDVQRRAGVAQRAWGRYFVQMDRDVPLAVFVDVCQALGVAPSEMLARVERRLD